MKKTSIIVTSAHMLLSALVTGLLSFKDMPLGVVAGLTSIFIIISVLAAACGTMLGLKRAMRTWVVLMLAILVVPALMYYSQLLSLSGTTNGQNVIAGLLY